MNRKYIIIPEFRPLWALKKVWGPAKGPLSKPTLVPIDIIGQLLQQTGSDKVTVYEVIPEGKTFSEPVQLTLENYMKPYEEIIGKPVKEEKDGFIEPTFEQQVVEPEVTIVEPEIVVPVQHGDTGFTTQEAAEEAIEEMVENAVQVPDAPAVEEEAPVVETTEDTVDEKPKYETEEQPEVFEDAGVTESPEAEVEEEEAVEEMTAEVIDAHVQPAEEIKEEEIDWSKMTKAERRALRRQLEAQKQNDQ